VLEGDSVEPDGKTVRNRSTWFDNEDGTVRQFWEMSRDGTRTWEAVFVGCSTTRHYHPVDSADARKIRPEHLVFFRDSAQAGALGFSAARS
jgi:hypothetical protein